MDLTEKIPYAGIVWKAASYEYAGIQYGAKSRLYSDYFRWRCSAIVWSGFMETRSVFPSDYTIRWL